MSDAIFLSYRRDDSEGEAGRLYDDLIRIFGPDAVFMDVSDIHPGKDFRQVIDDNVARCAVLLAIMGPAWTTIKDASGTRRLDQPNDFVRLEIGSALARGVDVIPVLVHGARMPAAADLPDNLQNLAYRNCIELTHARWNSDVEVLSRALREYVKQDQGFATKSIRMAITGQNPVLKAASYPSVVESPPLSKPAPGRKRTLAAVAVAAIVVVLGAGSYAYIHIANNKQEVAAESPENASPSGKAAQPPASPPTADPSPDRTTGASSASGGNAHEAAGIDALAGNWINPLAKKGKPIRIEIAAEGNLASIHLWTRNHDAEFDMGAKSAPIGADGITLQWQGKFSDPGDTQLIDQTVSMQISRVGDQLHMVFSDAEGASKEFDFVRIE